MYLQKLFWLFLFAAWAGGVEAQNFSFEKITFTAQTVELAVASPDASSAGQTTIDFKLEPEGTFFFRFAGELSSVEIDGRKVTNIMKKEHPGSTLVYYVPDVEPGNHRAKIQFLGSSSGGEPGGLVNKYHNGAGVGPASYFPSLNWPLSAPALKVKVQFKKGNSAEDYFILSNGESKPAPRSVTFSWTGVPTMQALFAVVRRENTYREFSFKAGEVDVRVLSISPFEETTEDILEMKKGIEAITVQTMEEMARIYGPYPHGRNLVMITGPGYSMEYRGAVTARPDQLRHELVHQWFATGVSPTNYTDMWLSEAIDVWIEKYQLKQIRGRPTRVENEPRGMTGDTLVVEDQLRDRMERSVSVYKFGLGIMERLDSMLLEKSGQEATLAAVLKDFYQEFKGRTFTIEDFANCLGRRVPGFNWGGELYFHTHRPVRGL